MADGGLFTPTLRHPQSIAVGRLSARERAHRQAEYTADLEAIGGLPERPRTLADCEREGLGTVHRCPWVGCGYHLALNVNPDNGTIHLTWPDRDPTEWGETCALAVAHRNPEGLTLLEVGSILDVTREMVRQVQNAGLRALRELADLAKLQDSDEVAA